MVSCIRTTSPAYIQFEADRHDRVSQLAEAIADSLSDDDLQVLAEALPLLDRIAAQIAEGASPADRGPVTGAW
ncbi:hypothetical protein ACMATS_37250 [Streptoverticillium reticulum]|uniref:hypothetical protein n=1 Tax=Streptoverticillium reticulum TaxID=1433415 RepID=UPI0039BF002C